MLISEGFQFSQASLQDFEECPRRFYLRYVLELAWPAVISEPVELHDQALQRGQDFHRLVQQHIVGIPEPRLSEMAHTPELEAWWQAYLTYRPADLPGTRYPEMVLGVTVAGYRLIAKYDLVVVQPPDRVVSGTWRATIFDWKTAAKPARAERLLARWQTRVYRYMLVAAGAHLNAGRAFAPEEVGMLYWYPAHPELPLRFGYTAADYATDGRELAALIEGIAAIEDREAFFRTEALERCGLCPYRSYCDRGEVAASFDPAQEIDVGDVSGVEIDFEQIAEIEF